VAQSSSTSGNRRREVVLVTAVSAVFVIIGVALGGPWYATAFFAAAIGAGAWVRPRDTRLPRDVAIKILPEGGRTSLCFRDW
jgi:hypothetical protein